MSQGAEEARKKAREKEEAQLADLKAQREALELELAQLRGRTDEARQHLEDTIRARTDAVRCAAPSTSLATLILSSAALSQAASAVDTESGQILHCASSGSPCLMFSTAPTPPQKVSWK